MNNTYSVAKSASIHPTAVIEDGAEIGENTNIGPFCIVRRGAKIGNDCKFTAYCEVLENVKIGNNTTFGSRCTISANAVIGKNVTIKYGFVLTDTPDLEEGQRKDVGSVGDGALIGANVVLMPGFSIGEDAIVGACSQVRSEVGNAEIWFGNPATKFKEREI